MSIDKRQSERFDTVYNITVRAKGASAAEAFARAQMTNLSKGGLCFLTPYRLERRQRVDIDFPALKPVVILHANVVWCRPQRDEFSVGAEFTDMSEALRARLVEMHSAIAGYQKLKASEGTADIQQLADEWFSLYGAKFISAVK